MTAAGAAAFASTHRMVDRVLGDTADVRTETEITFLTSLTELGVHQIEVADLTDHGTAVDVDHTDFAAGQLNLRVGFFLYLELVAFYSVPTCLILDMLLKYFRF